MIWGKSLFTTAMFLDTLIPRAKKVLWSTDVLTGRLDNIFREVILFWSQNLSFHKWIWVCWVEWDKAFFFSSLKHWTCHYASELSQASNTHFHPVGTICFLCCWYFFPTISLSHLVITAISPSWLVFSHHLFGGLL